MSTTTSGYVVPISAAVEDDELANLFQSIVVNLTGLDPTLVRPRWQPQPPTQPSVTTNWCAVGITQYEAVDYPQVVRDPTDPTGETATFARLERIDLLASFYGPSSSSLAATFRDGLYITQNHQLIEQLGVKLRSADDMVYVPELINSQYVSRSDLHCSFMRMISRTLPIATITSAQVTTQTANGLSCVEEIQEP